MREDWRLNAACALHNEASEEVSFQRLIASRFVRAQIFSFCHHMNENGDFESKNQEQDSLTNLDGSLVYIMSHEILFET